MPSDLFKTLKLLSETPGPVGREDEVQKKFISHIEPYCGKMTQDKIGNVVATLVGSEQHFALIAHADEVGFLISGIDSNGFLKTKWNTQGHMPDLRLLPGQRVTILTDEGEVPGCFCVKTAHIAGARGKKKIPEYDEVFLDVGESSNEDIAQRGIEIGDPVVYDTRLQEIGRNWVGKSVDDRIGLTIMIEIAGRLSGLEVSQRPTVTFVSTVMEELGAKGAAAIADDLDVDGVMVLDIGLADDYPGTSGEANVALGRGPVIVIKDNQMHYSHQLNQTIYKAADSREIPIQRAVYHNYATDGQKIASRGQRVSAIGIPCRYSHSSFETINPQDLDWTVQLVEQFLTSRN
ncbi:M42 family peptidase [Candidatus Thorarchaeota archaeon]|nr:MAG: M42 family peptidase [Candidatus Thorarchaeota archaeon]